MRPRLPTFAPLLLLACGADAPVVTAPLRATPSASTSATVSPVDASAPPTGSASRTLAVAGRTTCLVRGGRVHCFGDPVNAPDWAHDPHASHVPHPIAGIDDAVAVALAIDHACALRRSGVAACWGVVDDGKSGEMAHGMRPYYQPRTVDAPETAAGLDDGVALALGRGFSCALRATGRVACWGNNATGALGDDSSPGHLEARGVGDIDDAIEIAANDGWACARRRSGEVWCWGGVANSGSTASGGGPGTGAPRAIASLAGAAHVAMGEAQVCAIRASGDVACVDTRDLKGKPVVAKLDAVGLAIGQQYRCALRRDGSVACDGTGPRGQIGDGDAASATPRVGTVKGVGVVVAIAATAGHACALEATGALRCWGANDAGQAGQPFQVVVPKPTHVEGLTDAVHVAMAQRTTCALKKDGAVSCWGQSYGGALGGGGTPGWHDTPNAYAPQDVDGVDDAKQITGGGSHFCVIGKTGGVSCWGEYGSPTPCDPNAGCYSPEPIAGVTDAVDVSAYDRSTCAARKNGKVVCWGSAFDASSSRSAPWKGNGPGTIAGLTNVARVFAGYRLGCAVRRDGTVACFGADITFELDQRASAAAVFAEVKGGRDIALMGCGQPSHAVLANGELHPFEWSARVAPDPKHAAPVTLLPPLAKAILPDVVQIVQRQAVTCVRRRSGEIDCWNGGNPRPVGVDDAVDVALAEGGGACAVRKGGEVVCWGENSSGECGSDPRVIIADARTVAGLPPP